MKRAPKRPVVKPSWRPHQPRSASLRCRRPARSARPMIVRTIPERLRGRAGIFCQSWRELRCARPTNQALHPVLARARGLSYAAGKVVPPRSERERSRWAGRGRRTCRGAGVNRSGHGARKPATVPGRRRRRASSAAAGRLGGTGITAGKQRRCAVRPGPGLKTVRRLITMTEETMRANDGRAL